ncbi:hypothetical protein LR48_Vigan04g016300 [Vigna angularis]|uniref:Uncharacterized protein n=1 Tax=Phaseolus angularis TaxID=3914 RepID=A0A0L9UAN5_PHAAN|nr:hypothetical protein LR48_Vigan04g016300 [Vigna angularis]
MSSSSEYSEFSGQKSAKSPEKSSFSQTCSLLSQYIKEKGSFGDLTLGMTCNAEPCGSPETSCQSATTMNLFPTKENNVTPKNLTAMDLLSPQASYRPSEEIPTLINSSAIKSVSKVAKTANEIMSYARGKPQSQNNSVFTYTQSQPSFPPNLVRTSADSSAPIIPTVTITNSILEHSQPSSRPVVCDPPIARKASLHRFLLKRKDRIASKAPYQVPNGPSAESLPWLGLNATSPKI